MNSVQALQYALDKLEHIQISPRRPDALDRAIELELAITTLKALRDALAEQARP